MARSEPQPCDLLISAAYVVPVVPRSRCLRDASLVIAGGRIQALLPTDDALARYRPLEHIRRPHHVLLPGLVNAHGHSPMTLLRGFADDLPLRAWLSDHIWPAEARWVGPEFVQIGSELAQLEMTASGTTCFSDMYFFPEQTAEVVDRSGLRAALGLIVIDFPSAWADSPAQYVERGRQVRERWVGHERVSYVWAPHSPYATSDDALALLRDDVEQSGLRVHLHVNETSDEPSQAQRQYGMSQVERLKRHGLLNQRLMAAHFVHPSPEEIALMGDAGAHVLHCPQSNAKLASGVADIQSLLEAGINVALGTDGAASNNNLDMIEEMQAAALLGKLQTSDAAAMSATEVLTMATLGGAKALGLEDEVGSLEVGKAADCVCVDLRRERTWPVTDPVSQLVYAACGEQVTDTWVAGRALYLEGRHQLLDREAIFDRAAALGEEIGQSRSVPRQKQG